MNRHEKTSRLKMSPMQITELDAIYAYLVSKSHQIFEFNTTNPKFDINSYFSTLKCIRESLQAQFSNSSKSIESDLLGILFEIDKVLNCLTVKDGIAATELVNIFCTAQSQVRVMLSDLRDSFKLEVFG